MKKIIFVLAIFAFALGAFLQSAKADSNDKVTICHATGSTSNPYVTNQPNKSGDVDGHDNHNGGVYFAGLSSWGDIIPPFDYQTYDVVGTHTTCPTSPSVYGSFAAGKTCTKQFGPNTRYAFPDTVTDYAWVTHHYSGKNWDEEGQAVWNNSCNIPALDCDGDYDNDHQELCTTPTPTPVIDNCTDPNADPDDCTVNPTPTVTPTTTPTPTTASSTTSGGPGDGLGCATHDCSGNQGGPAATSGQVLGASTGPTQAVLGASTFAGTGTFETTIMNIMAVVGTILLGAGIKSYAKEKTK